MVHIVINGELNHNLSTMLKKILADDIVIHNSFMDITQNDKVIMICGKNMNLETGILPLNLVAVISSDLLSEFKYKDVKLISCGLSLKDSLTLSSYTQESAVINIQRHLKTFSGNIIEPREIPIQLKASIESFYILALVCVLILSDNILLLEEIIL